MKDPADGNEVYATNVVQNLTEEDAKKLTDIDSLIDNHILVNRYIIAGFSDKGKIAANGYYTVDMFDTIYGVSQMTLV